MSLSVPVFVLYFITMYGYVSTTDPLETSKSYCQSN